MIRLQGNYLLMECLFPSTISRNTDEISPSSVKNQRTPNYIFADSSLYQGTIRFNILLGANRDVTDEEIDNAAKDANVFPFTT